MSSATTEFAEVPATRRETNFSSTESFDGNTPSSNFQKLVSKMGREVASPEECVRLKYMWADAPVFRFPGTKKLAKVNPLRWGKLMPSKDLATELEMQAQANTARPLLLFADMPQQKRVWLEFCSPAAAAAWIHKTFDRPDSAEEADSDSKQGEPQEERCCVICLSNPREVMLMPCRHAVLCATCMESLIARDTARCPICRQRVGTYAHGFFVDDYVQRVQAMEALLERSGHVAYEGMYNNVRPLLVTGALLASGATACFVLAPAAVPALVAGAFAIGYVPWFFTTVAHFEQETTRAEPLTLTRANYFSRADLRNPLKLVAKAAVMAVAAPVSAAVFFVPYGVYAGLVRPLARAALNGFVRSVCFSVTAGKALGKLLAACAGSMADITVVFAKALHEFVLLPGFFIVKRTSSLVCNTTVGLARTVCENLLAPGARVASAVIEATARQLNSLIYALRNAIDAATTVFYTEIFLPTGRAVSVISQMLCRRIRETQSVLYRYALEPSGRVVCAALRLLAKGVTCAATIMCMNFVVPSGQAAVAVLQMLGRGIRVAAIGIHTYVLVPSGQAAVAALQMLARAVTSAATGLYAYVLVPSGQAAVAALQMLARGITSAATRLYAYVLVPSGQAAVATSQMLARGITSAATRLYTYVLVPSGQAAVATLQMLARGITSAATRLYTYVLAPSGQAAVATLQMLVRAASGLYRHCLVPCANVARASATASAGVAVAAFVFVILPAARASGIATVDAMCAAKDVAIAAGQLCVTGAASVYVYVIQPGSHEVGRAVQATCAIMFAVGRGAR